MSTSKNYTTDALSDLHTDRDVPVAVYPDENNRGALATIQKGGIAPTGPFDPPQGTTNFTSTTVGNVQTVQYLNGATVLKTITITYSGCNFSGVIS